MIDTGFTSLLCAGVWCFCLSPLVAFGTRRQMQGRAWRRARQPTVGVGTVVIELSQCAGTSGDCKEEEEDEEIHAAEAVVVSPSMVLTQVKVYPQCDDGNGTVPQEPSIERSTDTVVAQAV